MQIKLKYSTLELFPYLAEILPCAAFTVATKRTVNLFHRFVSRWLMICGVRPVACSQICHVMLKLWNSSACREERWCRASENRNTICSWVSGRFSCCRGESQVTAGAQTWRPQSPFSCRRGWSRHEEGRGEREESFLLMSSSFLWMSQQAAVLLHSPSCTVTRCNWPEAPPPTWITVGGVWMEAGSGRTSSSSSSLETQATTMM